MLERYNVVWSPAAPSYGLYGLRSRQLLLFGNDTIRRRCALYRVPSTFVSFCGDAAESPLRPKNKNAPLRILIPSVAYAGFHFGGIHFKV